MARFPILRDGSAPLATNLYGEVFPKPDIAEAPVVVRRFPTRRNYLKLVAQCGPNRYRPIAGRCAR